MDALLARFGHQALNLAIRSGIIVTSRYAISQCHRLSKAVGDQRLRAELRNLQTRLESRVQIISPAISLIELRSGRGKSSLEAAQPLASALRQDIAALGDRVQDIAHDLEHGDFATKWSPEALQAILIEVVSEIKALLDRIDREIPILQLAISASGESLSSATPTSISYSRLLQASAFLNIGDTQFSCDSSRVVQIGPAFYLTLYMLFDAHADTKLPRAACGGSTHQDLDTQVNTDDDELRPMWQEVLHKVRVRLCRTRSDWLFNARCGYRSRIADNLRGQVEPASDAADPAMEFAYHLEIIEDLDDDRFHDPDDNVAASFHGVRRAGLRESIPVHQVSKIFYADTGRILNIKDDANDRLNPVLLLKRDPDAVTPIRLQRATCDSNNTLDNGDLVDITAATLSEQAEIDNQLQCDSMCGMAPIFDVTSVDKHLGFPAHLDPEWMAFEVWKGDTGESDSDSDDFDTAPSIPARVAATSRTARLDDALAEQVEMLTINHDQPASTARNVSGAKSVQQQARLMHLTSASTSSTPFGAIKSSLSLLDTLIRLTSLQEWQQTYHLSIPDDIMNFFLDDASTSTTGLKGKEDREARADARRRVGFDPYKREN